MKVKSFCVVVVSAALYGCSSDDSALGIDLTGDYSISAPPFTELSSDGTLCGRAEGSLTIADNVISGSVVSGGLQFNVTGTVEPDGEVTGGFALSEQTVVDFEGSFGSDSVGFGSWVDNAGCDGAWQALMNP